MASGPNIYVSNGTCYSGRGVEADRAMIPCGNDYYGRVSCCQAGDNCLESGACFNGQFFVTYVAGCTDPEYEDETCPEKFDDGDAPWLGMAYCNGTSDTWVLCDQRRHPGTISSPDPCACPTAAAGRTMTLAQLSRIADTASLPRATGLTIAFQPGYYPSVVTAAAPAPTATATATTTTKPAAAPSSLGRTAVSVLPTAADAPAQPDHGLRLSTPATIGAAVGAAVAGLLLVAGAGWLLLRRRRRRRRQAPLARASSPAAPPEAAFFFPAAGAVRNDDDQGGGGGGYHPYYPEDPDAIGVAYGGGAHGDPSRVSVASGLHPSELDGKAARPWSMVSELDGGGVVVGGGARPVSDAPGRMEAILEQGQSYRYEDGQEQGRECAARLQGGHGAPRGQSQGASELPAESVAELPG